MVEGHNENINNKDSIATPNSKSCELIAWIRSLQQVLTVEVDHGFTNIQGRTNKFSFFVSGYLLTCPSLIVHERDLSKLKKLAFNYETYTSMSTDDRRRLIVNTRQTLHHLYKYCEIRESKEYKKEERGGEIEEGEVDRI